MRDDKSLESNEQNDSTLQKESDAAEQAEELLEAFPELKAKLGALPEEEQKDFLRAVSIQHFQGPLPPPFILKDYEEILPGSADRILNMSERQQQHRIELERARVFADIRMEQLGLGAGFILAVILAIGGIWLAAEGKELTGFAILVANIAVVVGAFYFARRQPAKEYQERPSKVSSPPASKK